MPPPAVHTLAQLAAVLTRGIDLCYGEPSLRSNNKAPFLDYSQREAYFFFLAAGRSTKLGIPASSLFAAPLSRSGP